MKEFKPEIVWMNPEKLVPHMNNAKKHPVEQIDKIAAQIAAVGFTQPIVVDKDLVIIVGHGRREAALRLNLQEVPVIVATHLDEHQAMAYRIADNKVAESEWDFDLLRFDMGTLNRNAFNLELTGFSFEELKELKLDEAMNPKEPGETKEAEDVNEGVNFIVRCADSSELLRVREYFGVGGSKIPFSDFEKKCL